jgi:hypothetical protein
MKLLTKESKFERHPIGSQDGKMKFIVVDLRHSSLKDLAWKLRNKPKILAKLLSL